MGLVIIRSLTRNNLHRLFIRTRMSFAKEVRTFLLRPLFWQTQNAVSRNVKNILPDQAPADGADLGDEVVAKVEFLEVG